MSRLTPEERAAAALDLVAVVEGFLERLVHVALTHGLSPEGVKDEIAPGIGTLLETLRREAGQ